ncbi:MAG: ATP-binding protein [Candidatus Omnitrophica bacterium]|nr:ATP-binding protein [Candidatus Omnitrophota bacterium]
MLNRPNLIKRLEDSVRRNPVTALLGPRQCGKTTLAHFFCKRRKSAYFDLEDLLTVARLENPMQNLSGLRGIVVIDEIQRMPELFKILRVLADRRPLSARFLILGSASFDLIRRSSESLAGRIGFVEMGGFVLSEIDQKMTDKLWLRGGFPKSFLAQSAKDSQGWREDFIRTFLERDIPQLGIRISPLTLRRFWTMVAHYHGRIWNGSEIGGSLGVAHTTVRQYLDILTGTFVIRQLAPWYQNIGKRLVKSPKIYIRDSGLLHSLLRISDRKDLQSHPKLGTSWEGFALEQVLSRVNERDCYFWATHAGAELDLLVLRGGKRWGFEFKFSDAPTLTKSMKIAKRDLALEHLWVIYPGNVKYALDEKIDCVGLIDLDVIL